MGIFDFFRKKKQPAQSTAADKQEEPQLEKLSLDKLKEKLTQENVKTQESSRTFNNEIKSLTDEFAAQITDQVEVIKNVDLSKRKEPQKIKDVVLENAAFYAEHLENLARDLKAVEPTHKNYLERVQIIVDAFKKNSAKSLEKTTVLVGKEMEAIINLVRTFQKNFQETITNNKAQFTKEKTIAYLNKILQDYHAEQSTQDQVNQAINQLEQTLNEHKTKQETQETILQELKESKEYKAYLSEVAQKETELADLNKELLTIKQTMNLKQLAKSFHFDKKKSQLIKSYAENFRQTLQNDETLEIIEALEREQPDFNAQRLKEIQATLLNHAKQTAVPEIETEKQAHETAIQKTKHDVEALQNQIDQEQKKLEKFNEKTSQTFQEIQEQTRVLWPQTVLKQ